MLIDELKALLGDDSSYGKGVRILVRAALAGQITVLECSMPDCLCPQGRGYFAPCGEPRRVPWAPTVDRWPVPGCDGGEYSITNVRLAHARCNYAHGSRLGYPRLKASGWWGSEEQRANSRRGIRTLHERWGDTAEYHEWHLKAGRAAAAKMTHESQAKAGRASFPKLQAWMRTPIGHDVAVRRGQISMCSRWNLKRGKPCTCGEHQATA